jgi:hypothetical protein
VRGVLHGGAARGFLFLVRSFLESRMSKAETATLAPGRPLSDVARALLTTANRLSAAGRAVTLAEMAAGACVGQTAARQTVANLKRHGHLRIVGLRRVSYRNRPVAEYAPATRQAEGVCPAPAGVDLGRCLMAWTR